MFFLARLRFPAHLLVLGVLKKCRLRFHQLNPLCFTKLPVYVWASKSQGVVADLEGFLRTHRVHTQSQKVQVEGKPAAGQFGGVYFLLSSWRGSACASSEEQVGFAVA